MPETTPQTPSPFQTIRLSLLRESALNPRRHYNEQALDELAASIREQGVLTPPLVRPIDGGFEARSVRDQCQAVGVPFFFKQWGEWSPKFEPGINREVLVSMLRVGKHAAGRLLDGREWNGMPEVER